MSSSDQPQQPDSPTAEKTAPMPTQDPSVEDKPQTHADADDVDDDAPTRVIDPIFDVSSTLSPFPAHMPPSNPPPPAPKEVESPFPPHLASGRPPPESEPSRPASKAPPINSASPDPGWDEPPRAPADRTAPMAPSEASAETSGSTGLQAFSRELPASASQTPSPFLAGLPAAGEAPAQVPSASPASSPFPAELAAKSSPPPEPVEAAPVSASPFPAELAAKSNPPPEPVEAPPPSRPSVTPKATVAVSESTPSTRPSPPPPPPPLKGRVEAETHEHDHPYLETAAAPDDAQSHRRQLERGAGRGKVLFLDAFSGISGDMIIAALVDLGVPIDVVKDAVSVLPLEGYGVSVQKGFAGSIGATRFSVDANTQQVKRNHATIDAMLRDSLLAEPVKELARRIFQRLAEAEAKVHRVSVQDVHFHEVGAVDAIVDIVGAAACFDYLGADVLCSALPMGYGTIESAHGVLPLPAPATLECLKGVPTYAAGVEGELVTPTGAAIVATVAKTFVRWPNIGPLRLGWGAGSRTLRDRPNALRVVLGDPITLPTTSEPTHVILQANIDDMTGELAGHAISLLLDNGALDAWAAAVTMKKGRPGLILSALSDLQQADALAAVLLRETSTLGVRRIPITRAELERHLVKVATHFGEVEVKVVHLPSGPRAKPEFDTCAALARKHNVGVQEVMSEAMAVWQRDNR